MNRSQDDNMPPSLRKWGPTFFSMVHLLHGMTEALERREGWVQKISLFSDRARSRPLVTVYDRDLSLPRTQVSPLRCLLRYSSSSSLHGIWHFRHLQS